MADQASITPSLAGQAWLKAIRHPFLNQPVTVTDFSDIEADDRGGLFEVKGRSVPTDVSDLQGSDQFTLELMTTSPVAERNLALAIKAGEQMFIQTPPGCVVPGGYVKVGTLRRSRRTRSARSPRRYFDLPCRVIAQPGPDIIGGTMTYGALINLYGGYNNVLAAHPTYAELLDLMATPEDLVVL